MNDTDIDFSEEFETSPKEIEEARIANIIESRDENKIFISNFKNETGRYISMYIKDHQVSSQIQITLSYIHANEKIAGIEITRIKKGIIDGQIKLTLKAYSQLIQILEFLKSIDYPAIQNQSVTFTNEINLALDEPNKNKLRTLFADINNQGFLAELLSKADIGKILKDLFDNEQNSQNLVNLLKSGAVKSQDVVNVGYRREQLLIFENMLKMCHDEKDWQKFFEKNEWIFGYGLDYKFNKILQREYSTGSQSLDATGDARGDFILTDDEFTILVELKTPATNLFDRDQYRNGCWSISRDLANATSQILSQKYELSLNFESLAKDLDGNIKLYDPKTILIIGHWNQTNSDDKKVQRIKQRTLELFRRNLRNVDILTFDELYNRAKHILKHDNN